jgi:hypothetical protein
VSPLARHESTGGADRPPAVGETRYDLRTNSYSGRASGKVPLIRRLPKVRLAAAKRLGLEGEWHHVLARLSVCSAPSSPQPLRRSPQQHLKLWPTAGCAADVSHRSKRFDCCLTGGSRGIQASSGLQRSHERFLRTAASGFRLVLCEREVTPRQPVGQIVILCAHL